MNFSLLMTVYRFDHPVFLNQALQSMVKSTVIPTEIVLVCDGKLTAELDEVINSYHSQLPIHLVKLNDNLGLGRALQVSLNVCQYEWIARFDADDICCNNRFEKQIDFLKNNPDIDVFGGQIIEFNKFPGGNDVIKKRVPLQHDSIKKYASSRNPVNHMTVMFRKSAVLEAGNYQHAPLYEDYDLWTRMLLKGYRFANVSDVLVYARAGNDLYKRRGGFSYARHEIKMQIKFQKSGFISSTCLIKNLMIRVPIRLVPNLLRKAVYSTLLRHRIK